MRLGYDAKTTLAFPNIAKIASKEMNATFF
jgi:hypothetical protein